MASLESVYKKAKRRVEQLELEAAKKEALADKAMSELKDVYNVDTIEDARELCVRLEKEMEELKEELTEALRDFETKWKKEIEE